MATIPTIPGETAGTISASADLNDWAGACTFLLGSASGTQPVFLLMASTTQALTGTFAAVNYSNTAALFKDNDGGWAAGSPSKYTIQTAGYWHIEWSVSAASSANNIECYAQVTTSASNPYNPSTTVKFQHSNRPATTAVVVASAAGLVAIYLYPNDFIQVFATVGVNVNTSSTFYPQFSGQWVSE